MPRPDEVLTVGVDLDAKAALQAMQKFQRQMKGEMAAVTKAVGHLGKVNKKALQAAVEGSKEWLDELDDIAVAHDKEAVQLDKVSRQIDALRTKQGKLGDEGKKAIGEQIKLLEKQAGTLANRVSAKLVSKASTNKMRQNVAEGLQKGIEEASPIFQSFFSKDLKGFAESGTKGLGKILGFGLKKGAASALRGGVALRDRGAGLSEAGKARGGASGGAMRMAGGAMKGASMGVGAIGKVASILSKLGPIVSSLSTVFMAVVKLLIDAEAQAKAFNKEILASASTAEFLAASGGDSDKAFKDLDKTLSQIRDTAHSLDNIRWGITAQEHTQVLNTLTQQGVSIKGIADQADAAGQSVGRFTAELTHVSVAYSRAFGVPLAEINQMQGEMMTDMGMSLDETKMSFGQMTRAAGESGIAANKFFAMIRGVSQDLSLYNTRMEDAVKTLKLLGKVMNPREAAKFMQVATQGLKQMDRQSRLRLTLLGGEGKMKQLVDRDLKSKAEVLGEKVKMSGEDVLKVIKTKGASGLEEQISKLPTEAQGAVREMAIQMQLQSKRAGKGLYGVSGAAADLGPGAAAQAMEDALKRFTGGKKLADAVGDLGLEALADTMGVSQEEVDQRAKFAIAIDNQREVLKKALEDGDAETITRLEKAGLKTAKDIDAAGYDQIYSAMDETKQQQMKDANEVVDYAKKQSELSSSALDKLGALVDFVMNQLYNILKDTWGAVWDMLGGTDALVSLLETLTQVVAAIPGVKDAAKAALGGPIPDILEAILGKKSKRSSAKKDQEDDRQKERNIREEVGLSKDKFKREALEKATKGGSLDIEKYNKLIKDKDTEREASAQSAMLGQALGDLSSIRSIEGIVPALKNMSQIDPDAIRSASGVDVEARNASNMAAIGIGPDGMPLKKESEDKVIEALADPIQAGADMSAGLLALFKSKNTAYVAFGPNFLKQYQKTVEEATLDSLRKALFEYFMYSKMDPDEVAKFVGENNMTPQDWAKKVNETATQTDASATFTERMGVGAAIDAPENAAGGLVTGVDGGLARVTAAAGEGLASVGKGERIVPRGGGGAGGGGITIPITVQGVGANDLAQIIHAKVVDGIAEYKRRERFT